MGDDSFSAGDNLMVQFQQQITNEVIISDATTGATVIQIGPGPVIQVVEGNATYTIEPNVNNDGYPGMQWVVGTNTNNPAYINIVPDGNNSPQIGINSGTFTDQLGRVARMRLFMANNDSVFQKVRASDGVNEGGTVQLQNDDVYLSRWVDNVQQTYFGISASNGVVTHTPISIDGESWHAPIYGSGFAPDPSFPLEYRKMADGTVQFRGRAVAAGATSNGQTIASISNASYWSTYSGQSVAAMPGSNSFQKVIWDMGGNITLGVGYPSGITVDCGSLYWSVF